MAYGATDTIPMLYSNSSFNLGTLEGINLGIIYPAIHLDPPLFEACSKLEEAFLAMETVSHLSIAYLGTQDIQIYIMRLPTILPVLCYLGGVYLILAP